MSDKFENIQVGDTVALRYEGLWHPAEVEQVQERFIFAAGMKFLRESGRQAGVAVSPVYAVPMTNEVQDIIDKRYLVAELSSVDWAVLDVEALRQIGHFVQTIFRIDGALKNV
jgi:hypothetical protein